MDHENAKATKLLDIRCAACGYSLVNAKSAQVMMGPKCRKMYGKSTSHISEAQNKEANVLIYQIARDQVGPTIPPKVQRLRSLGFDALADRIEKRLGDKAERAAQKPVIFIERYHSQYGWRIKIKTPYRKSSLNAWKGIRGRFWHRRSQKNSVPARAEKALWQLLQTHYKGLVAEGPKGQFLIQ